MTLLDEAKVSHDFNISMALAEEAARNCTLRYEHIAPLNMSKDVDFMMRLYNMCEHTWDPNKTWNVYYWDELLPPLFVYSITFILGILGNSLILTSILGNQRMRTPVNIFLASLALADILLCAVCIPVKLAELFSFSWTLGEVLCKGVNYAEQLSAYASILNLTVMSLERCYAIVSPMQVKVHSTVRNSSKVVVAIWIMAFILASPRLLIQVEIEVGVVQKAKWCTRDTTSTTRWRIFELYVLTSLLIIPCLIMTVAYGTIAREMMRNLDSEICMNQQVCLTMSSIKSKRGSERYDTDIATNACSESRKPHRPSLRNRCLQWTSLESSGEHSRCLERNNTMVRDADEGGVTVVEGHHCESGASRNVNGHRVISSESNGIHNPLRLNKYKRIIRMLLVIVLTFVLCWTPHLLFNVLQSYQVINTQLRGYVKHIDTLFSLTTYLNSCLNPFIYGFMSSSFRSSFKKSMYRVCCNKRMPHNSSFRTRSTIYKQRSPQGVRIAVDRCQSNISARTTSNLQSSTLQLESSPS